jgi:hypothetical protein
MICCTVAAVSAAAAAQPSQGPNKGLAAAGQPSQGPNKGLAAAGQPSQGPDKGLAAAAVAARSLPPTQPLSVSLRAAIEDLCATFADAYPQGRQYLARLDRLEQEAPPSDALRPQLEALQREALTANPLVSARPLVFVVRQQYAPDHHNTGTDFQPGEISHRSFRCGAAIKTIDCRPGGRVTTLLEVPQGVARDLEVHFDGGKLLFSMRRDTTDSYHIYEMNADGSGLRQLTFAQPVTDLDPCYLPDDRIVFTSTRDAKYCGCNRHIQANLFVMEADGANIRQIGRNNLFESRPSLMPDGRILYDRWEYVDRHFGPSFGLWTMNPDGTNHALYYGNNAWSPGAIFDARTIPGTDQVVAVFGACHDRPWGAMVILDRRRGLDYLEPVVRSWPADIRAYMRNQHDIPRKPEIEHPLVGQIDTFLGLPVKYEDPWPLSDKYCLCSRMTGSGEQMGIYLVDVFGNEVLLHAEGPGCFDPLPLAPRPRPPVLPTKVELTAEVGRFYVADVYRGTGMGCIPRGTIKTIRVVEAPPKYSWSAEHWHVDTHQAPAMNFNCTNNKRILGDAPVEPDGSAYFEVPADRFVFFQALDAEGMMVQSMRSGTTVRPGETAGCVGCHEPRLTGAAGSAALPGPAIRDQSSDSFPQSGADSCPVRQHRVGRGPAARDQSSDSFPQSGADSCPVRQHRVGRGPAALRREASRLAPWHGPAREFNYLTEVQPVWNRHCVRCHDYGQEARAKLNLAGDLGLVFNTSYLDLRTKSPIRWHPDRPGEPRVLVKAVDDGPPEVLPPYAWGSHRSGLVALLRRDHYGVRLTRAELDRIVTWIDLNAPYYGSYYTAYPDAPFGRSPLNRQELARLAQLTGVPVHAPNVGTELHGSQVSFTRPELSPCLGKLGKTHSAYREALAIIRQGAARLAAVPREDLLGAAARPVCPVEVARAQRVAAQAQCEARSRAAQRTNQRTYDRDASPDTPLPRHDP